MTSINITLSRADHTGDFYRSADASVNLEGELRSVDVLRGLTGAVNGLMLGEVPDRVDTPEEDDDRPTISVLCGSTRQRADFERLSAELTMRGHIVLSVGFYGHELGLNEDGPVKVALDKLHLKKIDMADEVHVIFKPDGGLGESTSREKAYAEHHGKTVVLHPAGDRA